MTKNPKILAFAGSLRKDSTNKKILKIAVKGALEAGGDVTYIDLADYPLPLYNQEIEDQEGLPAKALELKKLMEEHDGLMIASPEYNSSITGPLKNTIDWISRKATPDEIYLGNFMGKAAVIMSTSPGGLGGLRSLVHFRSILENIHVLVLPQQKAIPNNANAFAEDDTLKDPKQNAALKQLGRDLVDILHKLKG